MLGKGHVNDMAIDKEYEYCLRCGRKLKNPDARKIGYGKICKEKMKTEQSRKLFK